MANSAQRLAHQKTDDQEAASIGAHVDAKSGHWIDNKDGHYIAPAEADQRLNRTTAQGNADREQGNGGGFFDQLADRNQNFTGNLLKNVAPLAALIPGVGPLAAAGLAAAAGGLGKSIQKGSNLGQDLGQGLTSGVEGLGASSLAGGLGGLGNAASTAAGGAGATSGATGAISKLAPIAAKAIGGVGTPSAGSPSGGDSSGLPSWLSSILGTAGNILPQVNAANLSAQSNQYAKDAVNTATGAWDAKAPIRASGIAGILNPQAGATPYTPLQNRGNPFAVQPPPNTATQPIAPIPAGR